MTTPAHTVGSTGMPQFDIMSGKFAGLQVDPVIIKQMRATWFWIISSTSWLYLHY